jgi:hypothetical protein
MDLMRDRASRRARFFITFAASGILGARQRLVTWQLNEG